MNKVNVCLSEKDAITGYSNISIDQIPSLINGSIDELIFRGLDAVSYDQRMSTLLEILNKLKHKGSATLEFMDALSLGRDIYNGVANSKYVSSMIQNRSSVGYESDIMELIGNQKQFKIKNRYHNDTNIVMTIYKELPNG